jgi:hypothetical protein
MRRPVFFLLFAVVLLACSGSDSSDSASRVASRTGGLATTGVLPIPCENGKYTWQGSAIDLMTADAVSACSGDPALEEAKGLSAENRVMPDGGGAMRDGYLTYVRGRMMEALPEGLKGTPANAVKRWVGLRSDPKKNCDPLDATKQVDASLTLRYVHEYIADWKAGGRKAYANLQLRTPGFNLCIAQTLRAMIPGAAGGEALLLSEADQRMLLEVIRERAQMATLDYATLGVAFSRQYDFLGAPSGTASRYLPEIQWWALTAGTGSNPGKNVFPQLTDMGRDFAAAVQLHTTVTEELAALLARSGSARSPRGGTATTRADEVWGAGSWHQRLLASMLGGDPLANTASSPWERPDEMKLPPDTGWYALKLVFNLPGPPAAAGRTAGWDWPDPARSPYVTTDIGEPQVHELLRLARPRPKSSGRRSGARQNPNDGGNVGGATRVAELAHV